MEDMEVVEVSQDTVDEHIEEVADEVAENNEVLENEDTEDAEEFDPSSLFTEEDGIEKANYVFGEYDLSKYKDILDFKNEELVNEFNSYADKYSNLGFTQEQVEFILDERISEAQESERRKERKPTQKEIKERLQNSLTKEEIRNYNSIGKFVRYIVDGTEFEEKANEILQNPSLIKLFNMAYKKSLGKTTNINAISKKQERQISSMSIDDATNKLLKAIEKGEADESLVKQLKASVTDKEAFDDLLEALGRK